jgi:flavin-dependent thymidylate synthase
VNLQLTGSLRDIANSAWISTINEIRAASRSDDDVRRVVSFLVDHHHTSPFECVTLTFTCQENSMGQLEGAGDLCSYGGDHYSRQSSSDDCALILTMDLLNFIKVTMKNNLFDLEPWSLFASEYPELSSAVSKFEPLGEKSLKSPDVSEQLGEHNMVVELVSLHDVGRLDHNRATWRVKCPLSIAVQILRHRAGSYNMVSGRYKTIKQEVIPPVSDCTDIFRKVMKHQIDEADKAKVSPAGFMNGLSVYLDSTKDIIKRYEHVMARAKKSKNDGVISNQEYKRLREFARFVLPEGRMTELYITYYLDDFYNNYVILRDSEHAQTEHIWIAQEMQRTLEQSD